MRKIEEAVTVLAEHIEEIQTVLEWSEIMGYDSPDYFCRMIRNEFGVTPKDLIIRTKLEAVKEHLEESPDEIYYSIARKTGFIDNNSLYKFVKRHTGKTPSQLKKECQKGV